MCPRTTHSPKMEQSINFSQEPIKIETRCNRLKLKIHIYGMQANMHKPDFSTCTNCDHSCPRLDMKVDLDHHLEQPYLHEQRIDLGLDHDLFPSHRKFRFDGPETPVLENLLDQHVEDLHLNLGMVHHLLHLQRLVDVVKMRAPLEQSIVLLSPP